MSVRIHYGQLLSISTAVILLINGCGLGACLMEQLGRVADRGACPPTAPDQIPVTRLMPRNSQVDQAASEKAANLPLWFEPNRGQADPKVEFLSQGKGVELFITRSDTILSLYRTEAWGCSRNGCRPGGVLGDSGEPHFKTRGTAIRMRLLGANEGARIEGQAPVKGKVYYFNTGDPLKPQTDIRTYSRVCRSQVYKGIDVVYYWNKENLEYDFIVAPGANPKSIKVEFDGVRAANLDTNGDLLLDASVGKVRQKKPVAYQQIAGIKKEVASRYVIKGKRRVEFRVGDYDPKRELVIDPPLVYSTYLGADSTNMRAIAVDSSGSVYATGQTDALSFPTTAGAFQISGTGPSGYVVKLSPAGDSIVYSSKFANTTFSRITLDQQGNLYLAGGGARFPTTPGAFQTMQGANFICKLNAAGSAIVYSTNFPGNIADIAVDAQGNAYITGETSSADFPTTPGCFEPVKPMERPTNPPFDMGPRIAGFVSKLNAAGSALVFSTFLGGDFSEDQGISIAVDGQGSAYVTGTTQSTAFPTTSGAIQTAADFAQDIGVAFVTKMKPDGSGLVYSTLLGGTTGGTIPSSIALDSEGSAYITGRTVETDLPVVNAFQPGPMNGPILKTDDGADAFQVLGRGIPATLFISAISVDPKTPSIIYAGGSVYGKPSVYKSVDSGLHWAPVFSLSGQDDAACTALAIDPATPTTIYASVFDGTTAGSFEVARVYKSVDGGATWSATPGSGPRSSRSLLLIDPRNPATLYFYGAGGPYKTSDGGATWRAIEAGLSSQNCYSMAINPQSSSDLYLATEKGVLKSVDGGARWAATSVTANTLVVAIDPQKPQVVYAFITDILAESASGKANPRSRKGQDITPMGVLKSIDGGATWTQVNDGRQPPLGVAQAVVIDPNDTQILYLASTGNLFKSMDGGRTWQATAARDTNFGFNTLALTGGDRSVLYTNGSPNNAVFVAKIDPAGTALVYSTYMGGFSGDQGSAIAVDSAGSAVVVGQAGSISFPTTPDAPQKQFGGGSSDIFVARISASGSLEFSTFLGGNDDDMIQGRSLAVDSSRNIYVGGWTQSGNFPTTANALQSVFAGTPNHDQQNAFIAKLGAAGLPNPESTSLQITRAWITGKKLFLAGNGFQANSVVMINGQAQATAYDSSSAGTSLIARRGGKIIQSGQTVILQVQNPDGMSNQYSFTKP